MNLKTSFSDIGRDRIAQRYCNELGSGSTYIKARERIHWITANVRGGSVLDIGCSEGIVGILLGREGTVVCGVDINSEVIEYAHDMLRREFQEVQERVSFICSEIVSLELDQLYDTVVMGEVIEHVTNPKRLVEKGASFCTEGGRLIITTPLGFTGDADHKVVFTLSSFIGLFDDNAMITPASLDVVDGVIRFVGVKAPSTREIWAAFRDSLNRLFIAENELVSNQVRLLEHINRQKKQVEKMKKMKPARENTDNKVLDIIPVFESPMFQDFNEALPGMGSLELKDSSFINAYRNELSRLVNSCLKLDQIIAGLSGSPLAAGSNGAGGAAIVDILKSRSDEFASKIITPIKKNASRLDSKIKRLEKENLALHKQLDECGMDSKLSSSHVTGKFRVGIPGISTAERERLVASATKAFQKNGMQGACDVLEQSKLPYMNQAYILDEVLVAVS